LLLVAFIAAVFNLSAQWTPQVSNITPNYYVPFLDAVNENVVWGIVADPFAQTNPVAEFTKTVDGGATWIGGAISNAASLAPSCIFGLNADTAWVAMWHVGGGQGKILRTDDGGVTWNHQATALFNAGGNFPNWVYFWDANNGICMGDPTAAYLEIYTTTDGGTNWVRTPDANIAPELAGEFGITDVFTTQGDSTLYFGTNFGRIYKTTDRGLNFTAASTPFPDFIGAIAFRDANNGLCQSGGATGSTDVARTTDGGATWTLVGANTSGMALKLGLCYVPGTVSTYFISTPAAGGVIGTTYSPNDGNAWVLVDNLIHTDIEFVNDSTGWTGSNELNAPMFKWTTPITFAADDAASVSIDMAVNVGINTFSPLATFQNLGLDTNTFDVTMNITGGYASTKTITSLGFFDTQQITFDPWTPAAPGAYTVTIYTSLAGDQNNLNDTLTLFVTVYPEFENYGWVSKPPVTAGTFGLASAFNPTGTGCGTSGNLYAIGGADFTAVQSFLNAFNTGLNSWAGASPMTSPKYQFSAQRVGNKIYASGGYSAGFTPDANTYIYDLTNFSWSNGAPMPTPVGDYAVGTYNDSLIYYIGGYNGAGDVNEVKIYNTFTNTWSVGTSKLGTATAGLRGGIVGDKIVVVGGYSQILGGQVAEAQIGTINAANPNTINWVALPDYPGGPAGRLGGGIAFNEYRPLVYFTGGDPTGLGIQTKSDTWGYDLVANEWQIGPPKITAVSNISNLVGMVYNDSLWIASVAGYDGAVITTVNEWLNLGACPPVGINELTAENNNLISVYPNPANSELTVLLKQNNELESVLVLDISGRVIMEQAVTNGANMLKLNIRSLDAGVYFISVAGNDGSRSGHTKFVKE
ncbi:MAG: T9SS type A sorting domain-containing protein, partial [Bacteroidia bacterium]